MSSAQKFSQPLTNPSMYNAKRFDTFLMKIEQQLPKKHNPSENRTKTGVTRLSLADQKNEERNLDVKEFN